jgi:hypothetical protein
MTITRRQMIAGAASAGLVFPSKQLANAATPENVGAVTALQGQATAELGGRGRTLALADVIFLGDLVATQARSRLAMQLGAKTSLKLGAATRVRIDRHITDAGGELELEDGALVFDRPPASIKGETYLRSPYGLLAVRGTRFFAGPMRRGFGVFVVHGEVVVTAAGSSVRLVDGLGTTIRRPGAPPLRAGRWRPSTIQRAFALVD